MCLCCADIQHAEYVKTLSVLDEAIPNHTCHVDIVGFTMIMEIKFKNCLHIMKSASGSAVVLLTWTVCTLGTPC